MCISYQNPLPLSRMQCWLLPLQVLYSLILRLLQLSAVRANSAIVCLYIYIAPLDFLLHISACIQRSRGFTRTLPLYLKARDNRDLAMISLDFNLNVLTRDLSLYLENQVKVGLFGSGVLSLVLGFSAAYVYYYLISVAKVGRSHRLL
jgi:hypothetical protein